MSITKEFLKEKKVYRVKFVLPKEIAESANKVYVVGDFNNWELTKTPMIKRSNGTRSASVDLPGKGEYQFRYLIDETRWINDPEADKFVPNSFGDAENGVVVI